MAFSVLKKTAKGTVKMVADVPAWFGLTFLKANTIGLIKMIKPLFRSKNSDTFIAPGGTQAAQREAFEAMVAKLGLSHEDLLNRARYLNFQSMLFAFFGVLGLGYMFYLFFAGHLLAGLLSFTVALFLGSKYCICRFWLFQMRVKRLGCSFQEWLEDKGGV